MAVNADTAPIPPTIPAWQRGRFASWLVTVDHKRIGLLYIGTSGLFFVAGGIMALLIRTQLAQANENFITQDGYNELFTHCAHLHAQTDAHDRPMTTVKMMYAK